MLIPLPYKPINKGDFMLAIHKIFWYELFTKAPLVRQNEPQATMENQEQVNSYIKAYEWGGPTSALQLHHLKELSKMIKPGDTILDLACGPGPLLLELAAIYPECHFIGADLSPTMLECLTKEAKRQRLKNVSVLCEDIRFLPSLNNQKVDLIITTSALHHIPDEGMLKQVFNKMQNLLKPDGGFYIFDFGQLKSKKARDLCVAEVAKLAPPITAQDYDLSLQAAYPINLVFQMAKEELPKPYTASASSLFDFFYFLQSAPRSKPTEKAITRIKNCAKTLSLVMKIEHQLLRLLRRKFKIHKS